MLESILLLLALVVASTLSGQPLKWSEFSVSHQETSCVKLVSVGDWGTPRAIQDHYKWWLEHAVMQGTMGCAHQASALLLLGDNFYEVGVESLEDIKWQTVYESQLLTGSSLGHIPHLVVAGNHDHYNPRQTQPQFDYFNKSNGPWYFPTPGYYTRSFQASEGEDGKTLSVFVVVIESWDLIQGDGEWIINGRLVPGYEQVFDPETAQVLAKTFLPPHSDEPPQTREEKWATQSVVDIQQLRWLSQQLDSDQAHNSDWIVLASHYPVRSCATDHSDNPVFVRELEPLLIAKGVDAFLFGHDHVAQIVKSTTSPSLVHYGSGHGGKRGSGYIPQHDYAGGDIKLAVEGALGFMTHVFTPSRLITTVHWEAQEGDCWVYEYTQEKLPKNGDNISDPDCPSRASGVERALQELHRRASLAANDA